MSTVKLRIKGGYGEHGRSCFLVEYGREGHCYMVDCGIMDTDPYPYPSVTREELEKVDYIFMTHCHKDHSGAFSYFVENGFSGILVASAMTLCLGKIQYQRTHILCESPFDPVCGGGDIELGELRAEYGRSVIFPVPQYGRGLELFYMLKQALQSL